MDLQFENQNDCQRVNIKHGPTSMSGFCCLLTHLSTCSSINVKRAWIKRRGHTSLKGKLKS